MTAVSVVIPTYNRATLLAETVWSILKQTVPPQEILIIDDGSTDETAEVCARFPPPVRYIRQPNAGVAAARNRGLKEVRGDYVAFLDSDDLWDPRKLEIHLAVHRALPHIGWSSSDSQIIDPHGNPLLPPQGFARAFPVFRDLHVIPEQFFARALTCAAVGVAGGTRSVYHGDAYELLFEGNFVTSQSTVVRRELCERVGGFDPAMRVAEDTEYFHRVAAISPVAVIVEPLVKWRVGLQDHLTTPANTITCVRNALRSLERAVKLRQPRTAAVERAYRLGRRRLLLRLAYAHLVAEERSSARQTVVKAWQTESAPSPKSLAIYAATLIPAGALRVLHVLKRMMRRAAA